MTVGGAYGLYLLTTHQSQRLTVLYLLLINVFIISIFAGIGLLSMFDLSLDNYSSIENILKVVFAFVLLCIINAFLVANYKSYRGVALWLFGGSIIGLVFGFMIMAFVNGLLLNFGVYTQNPGAHEFGTIACANVFQIVAVMAAVIAVSFKFHHEMKALTGTFFYVYMTVRGFSLVFGGFISEIDLVAGALSDTLEPSLTLVFILYCVAIVLGTAVLFYFYYEKNEYVPQVDEPKKKDLGFPTPQKASTSDNEVYNY